MTENTEGRCHFCGEQSVLETHHIVPRRFDGSDKDENLVDVCPTCHRKLESLYDSRFYDKLNVKKPKESYGECWADECTATATEIVRDRNSSYAFCRDHFECCKRTCQKRPTVIATHESAMKMYCGEHGVCMRRGCRSRDVKLDKYTNNSYIVKCFNHADKVSDHE